MIRELGYHRNLNAKESSKSKHVRGFVIPKLRLDAEKYYEIIDWQAIEVTEPPTLKKLTVAEIKALIEIKKKPE